MNAKMGANYKKNIGAIIQARMGSTRLPGKILMKLDEENTILDLLIKRVKKSKLLDKIIIATTPDKRNQAIIDSARNNKVCYFIGDEENVLDRYFRAAKDFNLDIVIRLTSDNPFIDPYIIDEMISLYNNNKFDYISNNYELTKFPTGFHIEIFSTSMLKKVHSLAKSKPDKEHVTYFIYNHPELFSIYYYDPDNLKTFDGLRLTVDEKPDFILCKRLYHLLSEQYKAENFTIYDILEIIEKNPSLININKHIQQKKV